MTKSIDRPPKTYFTFHFFFDVQYIKESNGYSVIFPDLNWLSTCGETLTETMNAAVDCLDGYIYTSKKTNEEYSLPSSLSEIQLDKIAMELNIPVDNAFVNMISVDVELYTKQYFEKSVKKNFKYSCRA